MKIPVFVSCPTSLNSLQKGARSALIKLLDEFNLEPRALGRTDYPERFPLREVLGIARHCAGGVILGFEQFQATSGTWKRGVKGDKGEKKLGKNQLTSFPTPWNQLEAGILFGLRLPILIFREDGISGGIFDDGVTDVFIHKMPGARLSENEKESLKEVFLKWHARVSAHYFAT